jgi:hypothetical protein
MRAQTVSLVLLALLIGANANGEYNALREKSVLIRSL